MRKTIFDLLGRKGQTPVSMLTCYDYNTARTIDEAGVDMILVGDSLGNVMLGYENTLAVTVDDMIHHGKAVCRGAKEAFVVIDMPFMSYQPSVEEAVRNAGRIMKETGCQAVKLEGGREYADRIKAIVEAGIPVVAHIGLTPQSVNAFGGYKVQGKTLEKARKILNDAKAVEQAGAFAIAPFDGQKVDGFMRSICCKKIVIPAKAKGEILEELDQLCINEMYLFDGLEHTANYLKTRN